jgi:hypothetical protein
MILTLLQAGNAPPTEYDPSLYQPSPWNALWALVFGGGGWLYTGLLVWMVISCLRNDPERHLWLWIIIFLPFGPVLYFFARWIPSMHVQPPKALRRFMHGGELRRLQIAANQIGNAHQYVELGEALRDSGQTAAAGEAFQKALAKDGQNLQALWGAASVEYEQGSFTAARDKLQRVLQTDPAYKFGDVSLLYGKTLDALGDTDAARTQLEAHTRRWRHPEGLYLLATIYADQGNPAGARRQLESLIQDLDGAPRKIVRRQMFERALKVALPAA